MGEEGAGKKQWISTDAPNTTTKACCTWSRMLNSLTPSAKGRARLETLG